jgi:predicted Ser/Thr protein kinase
MAADLSDTTSSGTSAQQLQAIEDWLASAPAESGTELGRGYQARTTLYESPFGRFVVKTARGVWPWRQFGEVAIRREHAIYSRVAGVPGIPRCLGLIDSRRLVIEYLDGDTFRRREPDIENWNGFFEQLLETIRGIHARGVAHGDLKRKDNLIVGPNEQPYIIDFGVAGIERSGWAPWSNAQYRWMRQYDYNAWVKLKTRRQREPLTDEDAGLYRPTMLERIARVIRLVWQKLTLRRLRRRIWPRRP